MNQEEFNSFLEKSGLSQSDVARKVGVTRGTVCHWSKGRMAISKKHEALITGKAVSQDKKEQALILLHIAINLLSEK